MFTLAGSEGSRYFRLQVFLRKDCHFQGSRIGNKHSQERSPLWLLTQYEAYFKENRLGAGSNPVEESYHFGALIISEKDNETTRQNFSEMNIARDPMDNRLG